MLRKFKEITSRSFQVRALTESGIPCQLSFRSESEYHKYLDTEIYIRGIEHSLKFLLFGARPYYR